MNPNMVEIANLGVRYGRKQVLRNVTLDVRRNEILGMIGPAQSGKTTLLKAINRTIENVSDAVVTGSIKVDGEDVLRVKNLPALRRKIGMVAPLPVGLPLSIFDNVAFAPRMAGIHDRTELEERVERCLRQAALWDEVKDRLDSLGTRLSGGQQQRLTIAARFPTILKFSASTNSPSPSILSPPCGSRTFSNNCEPGSPSSW